MLGHPREVLETDETRIQRQSTAGWRIMMEMTMRARATGAALLACAAMVAGCTSDVPGVDQLGVAACRQAAAGIQDPASRQGADEACQFIRSGNGRDVSRAAKRTARQRCLQSTQQIVDPAARRTIEAFCPKV